MKIKIGPYRNWFGPYQLAELLCFWAKQKNHDYGITTDEFPDWVHDFGEWLAHGKIRKKTREKHKLFEERHNTWLSNLLSWIHSKQHRKIEIQIDNYDTWGMNTTLAHIIVPMLIQLRDTTHGYPSDFIVDESDYAQQQGFEGEGFEYPEDIGFENWKATLDKMIWAFEQEIDDDWEDQYRTGKIEFDCVPLEDSDHWQLLRGDNDTSVIDYDGMQKHRERMQEGFDLFAKYYSNLWD